MGYDLEWREVPEELLAARKRDMAMVRATDFNDQVRAERLVSMLPAKTWMNGPWEEDAETSFYYGIAAWYRFMERTGFYYRASISFGNALMREMAAQSEAGRRLGETIFERWQDADPEDVREFLKDVSQTPKAGPDHEGNAQTQGIETFMADVAAGSGVEIQGRTSDLARMVPEHWAVRWETFLEFLRGAAEHGGVRTG